MSHHDYNIANASGSAVRADINNVLLAIVSNNSSTSAPSTTFAYMWWADTTNGILKMRNANNNGWVELLQLDGTLTMEDGAEATPGLAFRDDLNTGIWSSAADTFNISTGGTERLELGAATVFNESGADVDFRIEGDTEANLFYVDAGNDRIGIGTSSPNQLLSLKAADPRILITETTNDSNCFFDYSTAGSLEISVDDNNVDSNSKFQVRIDGAAAGLTLDSSNLTITGNLVLANTKGINFYNYGTGTDIDSNLLDDYEEGTFVPTPNSNLTLNSTYHRWSYTKIGRQVTIRGLFLPSAVSGTDAISLTLPFDSANETGLGNAGGVGTMFSNVTGATAGVASFVGNNMDEMRFYSLTEGTSGWSRMANDDISTSTEIYFSHTYFAA